MPRQVRMRHRTDEELIQALGKGNEEALRTLVERHTAAIYKFSVPIYR